MLHLKVRLMMIVMVTLSLLLLTATNHVVSTYGLIPLKTRPETIVKQQQQKQFGRMLSKSNQYKMFHKKNTDMQNIDCRNKVVDADHRPVTTTRTTITTHSAVTKETLTSTMIATLLFCSVTFGCTTTNIANAESTTSSLYDVNDYASETVQRVIKELKDNSDNTNGIVKVYEDIASIITEGKGIGGSINYQGIQLERGFVSDEDTTIYNPGLSLLTESEKYRLLDAIVESKRIGTTSTTGKEMVWNIDTQAGYDYLREKLDPYHTYELQGFLKFVPWYGAILYMIVLGIQQLARDIFPPAYIISAIVFFLPIIVLVSIGPQ
jgi:hypothetical protein